MRLHILNSFVIISRQRRQRRQRIRLQLGNFKSTVSRDESRLVIREQGLPEVFMTLLEVSGAGAQIKGSGWRTRRTQ